MNVAEIESAILGSCIASREAIDDVLEQGVKPEHFSDKHRVVFQAITNMYLRGEPVDLVLLVRDLGSRIKDAGGIGYVAALESATAAPSNAVNYAKVLMEHHQREAISRALVNAAAALREDGLQHKDILDKVDRLIFDATERGSTAKLADIKTSTCKVLGQLEKAWNGEVENKLPVRWKRLDEMITMRPGNMWIIAGRPSMGKTAFMLNLTSHFLMKGKRGIIFSLEMTTDELTERYIGQISGVNTNDLRRRRVSESSWTSLGAAVKTMSSFDLQIYDNSALTPLEMRSVCRRAHRRQPLDWVAVDYVQLMAPVHRDDSRAREVSEISKACKDLAKELGCPMLVLSQLNRNLENRQDKRPILADLRESGSLEQDCDGAMFLHRQERYDGKRTKPEDKGAADIVIAKQRNGPIGEVRLAWQEEYGRFREYDFRY